MTQSTDFAQLDAERKFAGRHINPDTAELSWGWGEIMDPYGDLPDLPDEGYCIGRLYFARSPDGGMWISFNDLPKKTHDALWKKMEELSRSPASSWVQTRVSSSILAVF